MFPRRAVTPSAAARSVSGRARPGLFSGPRAAVARGDWTGAECRVHYDGRDGKRSRRWCRSVCRRPPPPVWHRLPDAGQRGRGRRHPAGRLVAMASRRPHGGVEPGRVPGHDHDAPGDQPRSVCPLASRDVRRDGVGRTGGHPRRPGAESRARRSAGVCAADADGEPVAERTSRLHSPGSLRLSLSGDRERASAQRSQHAPAHLARSQAHRRAAPLRPRRPGAPGWRSPRAARGWQTRGACALLEALR
jgi:hypothetical protein